MATILRRSAQVLALALVAAALGVSRADAQSIPTSDAAAFMGSWTLAIDAQGQAFELDLNVTDSNGQVAAQVSSPMGSSNVSRIAKDGEKLVLSYAMDAQGQTIPVAITLTPTAAGVDASLDFAQGMFTATGKGTKK